MKTNFTKTVLITLCCYFTYSYTYAQNGLENVIVEKYYVSNADDEAASVGTLPVGSVTYRIFIDMLPGYKFQMAYGNTNHPLSITTTTSFFNNEDRGATNPTYTKAQAKNNTVMLDSWLTVGAACVGNFGILKSEDNGIATVVNADGVLQNTDPGAGIPLTTQDGLILGSPGAFGTLGIDSAIAAVFDATSQAGNSFTTTNGAWYCLAGAVGPDTTNKVLIAQITTDGTFAFQLNIQIGTPSGDVQKYVANSPIGTEIYLSSLTYNSLTSVIENQPIQSSINQPTISVFPNPSNGIFSLHINKTNDKSSSSFYTIYNMIGNVVLEGKTDNTSKDINESIDMSSFPKGIYFINVVTNGVSSSSKLILK